MIQCNNNTKLVLLNCTSSQSDLDYNLDSRTDRLEGSVRFRFLVNRNLVESISTGFDVRTGRRRSESNSSHPGSWKSGRPCTRPHRDWNRFLILFCSHCRPLSWWKPENFRISHSCTLSSCLCTWCCYWRRLCFDCYWLEVKWCSWKCGHFWCCFCRPRFCRCRRGRSLRGSCPRLWAWSWRWPCRLAECEWTCRNFSTVNLK